MLKARMGKAGNRVPTIVLPDWVVWLASFFDSSLKQFVPILGTKPECSNEKAKCVLVLHPVADPDPADPELSLDHDLGLSIPGP